MSQDKTPPRKFFGTDGVRGLANSEKMTPESVMRLGQAAGRYFRQREEKIGARPTVFIGKDTRLSGYMIEPALVAGFTSVGMDVRLCGPIPTSAVSILTRTLRADMGVMITASHNKYHDNGLKFFGPDGRKLSNSAEAEIEALLTGLTSVWQSRKIWAAPNDMKTCRPVISKSLKQLSRAACA